MAKKKVLNKNKKPTENSSYYFVAHVDSEGEVTPLLLTDVEYEKAKKRADSGLDVYSGSLDQQVDLKTSSTSSFSTV